MRCRSEVAWRTATAALAAAKADRLGPSGWIGMYLDKRPDWKILESLVRDAYCLTAPRKLSAVIDG